MRQHIIFTYFPVENSHGTSTLGRWMNSGRRVRADGLVVVLIKKITPFIFSRRRLQGALAEFQERRHAQFTGNSVPVVTPVKEPPLAYFTADSDRDLRAEELVTNGSVASVEFRAGTLTAKVVSQDLHRMRAAPYICRLWPWCDIMCTCADFVRCGGFCKHLRGALIEVCGVMVTDVGVLCCVFMTVCIATRRTCTCML